MTVWNQPLGPPIRNTPPVPEWVPTDRPGVERSLVTGKLRTNFPLTPEPPKPKP